MILVLQNISFTPRHQEKGEVWASPGPEKHVFDMPFEGERNTYVEVTRTYSETTVIILYQRPTWFSLLTTDNEPLDGLSCCVIRCPPNLFSWSLNFQVDCFIL